MATIGSDGSESKEGKDDTLRLAGLKAMNLHGALPPAGTVQRKFVKVTFVLGAPLTDAQKEASSRYWQEATSFGLVDASLQTSAGDNLLILAVRDDAEAQALAAGDPNVKAGTISIGSVQAV